MVIDQETHAIANRMLNVESNDWRVIAAAGEVEPRYIEEVLSWNLPKDPEDDSLTEGLRAYRREIEALLKDALNEYQSSQSDDIRGYALQLSERIAGMLWETPVQPNDELRATIAQAVRIRMGGKLSDKISIPRELDRTNSAKLRSRGDYAEAAGSLTLSPREVDVLQLTAEGLTTKEIAANLHISVKTVEIHRRMLMDKLNLDSRAALTKYALRAAMMGRSAYEGGGLLPMD